jgi:hypothetical protein
MSKIHKTNKEKCIEYFELFSNKDLKRLEEMFSDEITLRDWEIQEKGKSSVLQANKKIFDSVKSISVNPIHIYSDEQTVIAELEIMVNNTDRILVVDLISFDETGKIIKISAYKG